MPDNTKVLIRNAREQDIPTVAEIDAEAFSSYGTAETAETFQLRLTAFEDGFIILVAENEIAAYASTEKWLTEREPGLGENPLSTHHADGRILCVTALAVKTKFRGRGYGLLMLDKLIEIAHREGCKQIILETTHAQGLFLKRGFKSVKQRSEGKISLDVMSLEIESYGSKASM
jgi:ribosomal protein S18 acetylase RimI-like enzyme